MTPTNSSINFLSGILELFEQYPAVFSAFSGLSGVLIGFVGSWFIAKKERITQFRLAALEKRLAVHQEAYTLWTELYWSLNKPEDIGSIAHKCQEWWYRNCLYLDPESRKSFKEGLVLANNLLPLSPGRMTPEEVESRKISIERIRKVLELLVQGVNLPTIGKNEGSVNERI